MVLVIDPQIAGVSGDMLLCALVDLGANQNKILEGIKQSEKFFLNSSINKIIFNKIQKNGIHSTELILDIKNDIHQKKGSEIKKAITDSVQVLKLSDQAKIFAESCINTLISAESKIHGISEDIVHFHEASSIDTLVDIVGITIALDDLRLFDEKIICLPISIGSGFVTFSHGTMSNPASAILEIFKNSNLIIKGNSTNNELTTPTGACVLVNLFASSEEFFPPMKIISIGYGAGQKNFKDFSNVLKMVRGHSNYLTKDSVKILETNLDDISGEILGNLIDKIMKVGAKDISIFSGITKKGRPTNLVSVICDDKTVDSILDMLIIETRTLGVRIFDSNRVVVPRSIHNVSLSIGAHSFQVTYKKSLFKEIVDFKIEFEDIKHISDIIGKSLKETESLLRAEIKNLDNPNEKTR